MRYSSLALLASLIAAVVGSGGSRSISIATTKYNALFAFGDSMTETDNICLGSNSTELEALTCTHRPYGMTYFGKPSSRWCNGRVVIDFTGFSNPFEACCGAGGGKYNFDITKRCGMPGATTACRDPSARPSWDGIHPSEAANKFISDGWLHGPYCTPPILG